MVDYRKAGYFRGVLILAVTIYIENPQNKIRLNFRLHGLKLRNIRYSVTNKIHGRNSYFSITNIMQVQNFFFILHNCRNKEKKPLNFLKYLFTSKSPNFHHIHFLAHSSGMCLDCVAYGWSKCWRNSNSIRCSCMFVLLKLSIWYFGPESHIWKTEPCWFKRI